MTEFQQWLDDVYQDIKQLSRREDGSYNTEAETEEFMERFGIIDYDSADNLLCGIHCNFWDQVDRALEALHTDEGICLETMFRNLAPEEIVI